MYGYKNEAELQIEENQNRMAGTVENVLNTLEM